MPMYLCLLATFIIIFLASNMNIKREPQSNRLLQRKEGEKGNSARITVKMNPWPTESPIDRVESFFTCC